MTSPWTISTPSGTSCTTCTTCTSALGYRPAVRCERIVQVVGDLRFHAAVGPLVTAGCLMSLTLTRPAPALTQPPAQRVCALIQSPVRWKNTRDRTAERALRLIVAPSTVSAIHRYELPLIGTTR